MQPTVQDQARQIIRVEQRLQQLNAPVVTLQSSPSSTGFCVFLGKYHIVPGKLFNTADLKDEAESFIDVVEEAGTSLAAQLEKSQRYPEAIEVTKPTGEDRAATLTCYTVLTRHIQATDGNLSEP